MLKHIGKNRFFLSFALVFLLLLTLGGCTGRNEAPEETPPIDNIDWHFFNERAETFITAVANGDFDQALALFDETMSGLVDAEILENLWENTIVALVGDFIEIHEIKNETVDEYFIANVFMRHEHAIFGWDFTFLDDGLIAGLFTGGAMPLPEEVD